MISTTKQPLSIKKCTNNGLDNNKLNKLGAAEQP